MNPKKQRAKARRRARKLADQAWQAADEGNYDLAVKIIGRAVDLDPGNPVLWNDQGLLCRELGEDTQAADSFQAAITLTPDFAEAYANLAELRVRQGCIGEAGALQQQAVRYAPESSSYAEMLAAYRAMAGQRSEPDDRDERASPRMDATCPIEQVLRSQFPGLAGKVDRIDWQAVAASLTEQGYVLLPKFLSAELCQVLREVFDEHGRFAQTVVMDKEHFGRGCYRYFAEPLPSCVDAVRRIVYPPLAEIANAWQQLLGDEERYPTLWEGLRLRCAAFEQTTPTPILLRYEAGGFNDLHRDLRGMIFFPIQMAVVLSPHREDCEEPDDGFSGGEFLFCDAPVRKKSDRHEIPAGQGDAILFCTRARLVSVGGKYGWQPVKHGAATVTAGTRYVLGLPFHEYQ